MEDFKGTSENDLFAAGHFAKIIHYNGETFFEYEGIPQFGTIKGLDVSQENVIAVGFLSPTAQAFVIRGYR